MNSNHLNFALCFVLTLAFSSKIYAQNNDKHDSHYHDFDFWIGNWDVYNFGTDSLVGLSKISSILNHKTIEEKYQSAQGLYKGTSNNIYNASKDRWEQYWVDNSGLALHIVGGLSDGKMILSNCDAENCNKIVWTPQDDKSVRQEWLQSVDKGVSWTKIFDGHYIPKSTTGGVKPALPHLIDYPNIRDFTLSADGLEAYITIQNPTEEMRTICKLTRSQGVWSQPIPASFSGKHKDLEPYFSPDNKRLYFVSNRPNAYEKENYDIYYVEREHNNSSWSEPKNVGKPVNTEADEYYPAIASSGNLYFTCVKPQNKGKDDIYQSTFNNLIYSEPVALDTSINTIGYEFNSFIAPDESYIIFSGYNRTDGMGSGDLYISYKSKDGTWSTAKNLTAKINSKYMEYCPFVDIEKEVLYFTSRRMTPNNASVKTTMDLEKEILKYENGSSRIYQVGFK